MKTCITEFLKTKYWIYVLMTMLAGCAAGTPYIPGPLAYTTVVPGSVLKLNKVVTITPPEAGVRFQNGKVAGKNYNQWHPNCRLELRDPVTANLDIQPEEFSITRVTTEYQVVQSRPILLAAAGLSFAGGTGSATAEKMTTYFWLQSQKQPAISRLSCQYWENPEDSRHLMLNEIEQALGEFFTFQVKQGLSITQ